MDILKLTERIEIGIQVGESHYREFKSAIEGSPASKKPRDVKEINYDIAKTLVAFANADGGELFVGIEDDGQVTGVIHKEELITAMLNACKSHVHADTPLELKRSAKIPYNNLIVLYFSVDKGSKIVHLTSKGECFQRKDKESLPTAAEKIQLLRTEQISREYDRQFIENANICDLNFSVIMAVSESITKKMSSERFLQYLDLAEFDGDRLRLRRAALLLFATNPNRWHPRLQVRLLRVNGTEEKAGKEFNIDEIGEASGNIIEVIDQSWDLLRPFLTETRFSEDGKFKTQIAYPDLACKEALINAITHRDYSNEGACIEVRVFSDKLTISNPGQLLGNMTVEDLKKLAGIHQTRNTYIARVLREMGHIRELGEGIKRIFELLSSNDLVSPFIQSFNNKFTITLFYKFTYSREEKLWLDSFKGFELSRDEKIVVRLGCNGRLVSTAEIMKHANIVSEDKLRQLIESLRSKGILKNALSKQQIECIKKKNKGSRKNIAKYQIMLA